MGSEHSTLDDDSDPRLRLLVNLQELEQQLRSVSRSADDREQGWDPKDCSDGMVVYDDGKTVTRKITLQKTSDMVRAKIGYNGGTHMWEIQWNRDERGPNAVIGVATSQAKPLRTVGYHSLLGSDDQSLGWDIVRNVAIYNGTVITKYPENKNTETFKAPDVITVILNMDEGSLGFKAGGENYGVALRGLKKLGRRLYPAVSLTKDGAKIGFRYLGNSLTGRPERVLPPPTAAMKVKPKSEVELIVDGIGKVIKMLKEKNPAKIKETLTEIENHLLDVYERHSRSIHRQIICDKLAEMDGAQAIIQYWLFLKEKLEIREEVVTKCFLALRNVCWNFTDASLKLAQELAKCGLIEILAKEINQLKDKYQEQKIPKYFMVQCLAILENCAKPAENRIYYTKHKVPEKLKSLIDPSHHGFINIVAIMTTSYVVEDHCQPEVSERLIGDMVNILGEAVGNDHKRAALNYGNFGGNITALELATSFTNLAANHKNQTTFVRKDVVTHLVTLMNTGDATEQECAANCVWNLISPVTRDSVASTSSIEAALNKLGESDIDAVKQAATRATLKLTNFTQRIPSDAPHRPRNGACQYNQLCNRYLKNHLKVKDGYLNTEFHMCYCTDCHTERDDKLYYTRGQPPKDFGVPIGWVRYGLHVNRGRAKAKDIFEKWHRAYHGTKPDDVNKILDTGDLLMPGDYALGGDKLGERAGHFTDDRKPEGFDTKKIFVSPSIRYAGHDAYATPHRFKDTDDKAYKARVAFLVCIEPECYEVGNETVGLRGHQIDPKFSNQEIEWSTKQRGAVFLYGLLVKLENEIRG